MSQGPVTVSVVIPVRNGGPTIGAQLRALAGQAFAGSWEIVIADNGSSDDTRDVIESLRGDLPVPLTVVAADQGVGINVARNAGVAAASGDLILICDADDVVHPGWVRHHVEALKTSDLSGGPLDLVSLNSEEVAALHDGDEQEGCPVTGRFLPYATGCNMGFRRVVWERLGGFDAEWVRGHTETEFCWRAQLEGFELGWASGAVVAYRRSSGLGSELRRLYRSARALPRLYRQFGDRGMPRSPLRKAIRAWLWLLYRLPRAIGSADRRVEWLQVAAWRAGLLMGSVRYRTFYP